MSNLLKDLFTHCVFQILYVTSNEYANISYELTNVIVKKSSKRRKIIITLVIFQDKRKSEDI